MFLTAIAIALALVTFAAGVAYVPIRLKQYSKYKALWRAEGDKIEPARTAYREISWWQKRSGLIALVAYIPCMLTKLVIPGGWIAFLPLIAGTIAILCVTLASMICNDLEWQYRLEYRRDDK